MKRLLLVISILTAVNISQSQDITPPPTSNPVEGVVKFFQPLLTATNWAPFAYGLFDQTSHKVGAGVGAIYNINNYAGAWVRGEYDGNQFTGGSGSLTLQLPIPIMGGKAVLMPLAYTGAGTVLGGLGNHNGQLQGIVGAGITVNIGKFSLFTSYEKRSNDNDKLLGGLIYKF